MVRLERVGAEQHGQRIDNYLIKKCPGVPRSHLYKIIRSGEVRVDGRRIRQTHKLSEGEQVRIPPLTLRESKKARVPERLIQLVGRFVLLEDTDFLVVNKPPGLAVHGGSGLSFGLIDALRQHRNEPALELAHRLDRATSGCLLIGRGMPATRRLQNLFRERSVEKGYRAIVDGRWPSERKCISAPLKKNSAHAGERRVIVCSSGQPALTHFDVLEHFSHASMMSVLLETGRMHQIRVHACHVGHPLVGDTRYGINKRNQFFKEHGLRRLFLHAEKLAFDYQGRRIECTAKTDTDWDAGVKVLRAMS